MCRWKVPHIGDNMIYCNNEKCINHIKVGNPVTLNFDNENYNGFKDEINGECYGPCHLCHASHEGKIVHVEGIVCNGPTLTEDKFICEAESCIYNENKDCRKTNIFVDKSEFLGFICKNFSPRRNNHNINIWRFLNSDGTAKGGHIDDDYAKKLTREDAKFKSLPTGHRDAKELKYRGKPIKLN